MEEKQKLESKLLLNNTIRLACFTVLAIVFETWWIVLFAGLFWTYIEREEKR